MENKKFDIDKYIDSGINYKPIEPPPPIQYTIENKNGIYEYSDSFKINKNISLIRIKTDNGIKLRKILKKVLIKGKDIDYISYDSANAYPNNVIDIPVNDSLNFNKSEDLIVELGINSKIELFLFFEYLNKGAGSNNLKNYIVPKK